jgi:hypothetical protein
MMGLEEIIAANENPEAFARSRLSDGQLRRELASGRYWSEGPQPGDEDVIVSPAVILKDYGKLSAPLTSTYFDGVKRNTAWIEDIKFRLMIADDFHSELRNLKSAGLEDFEAAEHQVHETMKLMDTLTPCHVNAESIRPYLEAIAADLERIAPTPTLGYYPKLNLAHAMQPIKQKINALLMLTDR